MASGSVDVTTIHAKDGRAGRMFAKSPEDSALYRVAAEMDLESDAEEAKERLRLIESCFRDLDGDAVHVDVHPIDGAPGVLHLYVSKVHPARRVTRRAAREPVFACGITSIGYVPFLLKESPFLVEGVDFQVIELDREIVTTEEVEKAFVAWTERVIGHPMGSAPRIEPWDGTKDPSLFT